MEKDGVCLVTGASSGLGRAVSEALAAGGFRVVMLCRSAERAERALFELRNKVPGGRADIMLCDLSNRESIEDFCERFTGKYGRLDALINNAGTMSARRRETKDGLELCFGVNYIGHFLLTARLLPLLKKSAPSRIVVLTSIAHRLARIRFEDVNLTRGYNVWRGYAQSKLAGVMFTRCLAERLKGTGVTANCIHPGIVATDIIVSRESGAGSLLARLQRLLFMPPEKGARAIARLAASPEYEGITGKYFSKGSIKRPSRRARDGEAAKRLWDMSEAMCGIKEGGMPSCAAESMDGEGVAPPV